MGLGKAWDTGGRVGASGHWWGLVGTSLAWWSEPRHYMKVDRRSVPSGGRTDELSLKAVQLGYCKGGLTRSTAEGVGGL